MIFKVVFDHDLTLKTCLYWPCCDCERKRVLTKLRRSCVVTGHITFISQIHTVETNDIFLYIHVLFFI